MLQSTLKFFFGIRGRRSTDAGSAKVARFCPADGMRQKVHVRLLGGLVDKTGRMRGLAAVGRTINDGGLLVGPNNNALIAEDGAI